MSEKGTYSDLNFISDLTERRETTWNVHPKFSFSTDFHGNDKINIIDYKTGNIPSIKNIKDLS